MSDFTIKDYGSRICHDRHAIEIHSPNDLVDVPLDDAEAYAKKILSDVAEARKRKVLPCPSPFMWEGEEFACTHSCTKGKTNCSGGVGKYEFYPSDMVRLRDWLNEAIAYHEKNECGQLEEWRAEKKNPKV